jgi:hypothetical protein
MRFYEQLRDTWDKNTLEGSGDFLHTADRVVVRLTLRSGATRDKWLRLTASTTRCDWSKVGRPRTGPGAARPPNSAVTRWADREPQAWARFRIGWGQRRRVMLAHSDCISWLARADLSGSATR